MFLPQNGSSLDSQPYAHAHPSDDVYRRHES